MENTYQARDGAFKKKEDGMSESIWLCLDLAVIIITDFEFVWDSQWRLVGPFLNPQ